ncbi:MAG: O-acetylhomoserine aminocarboxypropyltransferase [Candidatus Glassbacteria bacterium RIFCSPLOWO2_12_FULL_58_11]|uniref:O-acetylhomoserine aminocarboxypropyltransferase n=2 Tax=Candidatus Glassiibacteriota TaxID=1817805 RepID=A0A1F5YXI9_9BACT|nr:MAG: O-acetylhomoserine aminocarboxypropyltransferase [Candidatus Glassbacteria bacterium GWA2_58_10]OGG04612.1 MAG: O-acetylhomoserine aminocarboxypropyltransferase [Candidatus Glassbacteria bacterium RIFCSPLOWO2_12_FULL_58_11]
MSEKKWKFDTLVIHGAQTPELWRNASLAPIYQSAAIRYDSAEELSEVFAGKKEGFTYQRLNNPTNEALEKRLCLLEGGLAAVVTSSGMAAVNNALQAILRPGDQIVCSNSLFQATYGLLTNALKKLGIEVRFVETCDPRAWEKALSERTKLVYVETIGNPRMDVPDIKRLAELSHKNRAPLIIDNTLATPYLFRPLDRGADIVVHSTTKYFNGHGSAVGGVVIDSGNFDWPEDKYPDFKVYKENKAKLAYIDKLWREIHVSYGTCQAPFHSYLTLIGLDTLALRMQRHQSNAQALAEFLAKHLLVKWVNYPGLPESSSHATAQTQFGGKGYGALLTFGLEDEKACFALIRRLKLVYHLANLGDCKTLIIHPWSSQYINFPVALRRENCISPDMLRVSVGIEAVEDLMEDFDQALKAV